MASFQFMAAAIGGAEACLKGGKKLVEMYRIYKNASEEFKANLLKIEAIWSRTAVQLQVFMSIANTMEQEHCRIHNDILEMLQSKLNKAIAKIEPVVKTDKPDKPNNGGNEINKMDYALIHKAINEAVHELEWWQHMFDPTWYLILRINDRLVDSELVKNHNLAIKSFDPAPDVSSLVTAQRLRSILKNGPDPSIHVNLSEQVLDWDSARAMKHSTTRIVKRAGKGELCVVDSIADGSILDPQMARSDAELLAKKLKRIEPGTFGLLSCRGLIKLKDPKTKQLSSINLVFSLEGETGQPSTLRQQFLETSNVSLTRVLDITRQLAKAVIFVHTCDFVHKNIRPETILVFSDSQSKLGSTYLLGFDSFRGINLQTRCKGDDAWERNLYRHPKRQGIHAHDKYIMQHDVYSLGVCLLELGLWQSFVHYKDNNASAFPSAALGLDMNSSMFQGNDNLEESIKIKDHLVDMAKSRLPARMGDLYTSVVITCLTCLDEGNPDFGDGEDMRDEDGILIGVRFIEKVLIKLSEIRL